MEMRELGLEIKPRKTVSAENDRRLMRFSPAARIPPSSAKSPVAYVSQIRTSFAKSAKSRLFRKFHAFSLLKLLAPEIGLGDVSIATPRIRQPRGPEPHTSDPFRGACSEIAEILKIWRNFGNFGNSANSRNRGNSENLTKFRKFREFRKFQRNPGGEPMDPGHPARDPEKSRLSSC